MCNMYTLFQKEKCFFSLVRFKQIEWNLETRIISYHWYEFNFQKETSFWTLDLITNNWRILFSFSFLVYNWHFVPCVSYWLCVWLNLISSEMFMFHDHNMDNVFLHINRNTNAPNNADRSTTEVNFCLIITACVVKRYIKSVVIYYTSVNIAHILDWRKIIMLQLAYTYISSGNVFRKIRGKVQC